MREPEDLAWEVETSYTRTMDIMDTCSTFGFAWLGQTKLDAMGKACRDGDARACTYLGLHATWNQRRDAAYVWNERGCAFGSTDACSSNEVHWSGARAAEDQRSCLDGDPMACFRRATMLEESSGKRHATAKACTVPGHPSAPASANRRERRDEFLEKPYPDAPTSFALAARGVREGDVDLTLRRLPRRPSSGRIMGFVSGLSKKSHEEKLESFERFKKSCVEEDQGCNGAASYGASLEQPVEEWLRPKCTRPRDKGCEALAVYLSNKEGRTRDDEREVYEITKRMCLEAGNARACMSMALLHSQDSASSDQINWATEHDSCAMAYAAVGCLDLYNTSSCSRIPDALTKRPAQKKTE